MGNTCGVHLLGYTWGLGVVSDISQIHLVIISFIVIIFSLLSGRGRRHIAEPRKSLCRNFLKLISLRRGKVPGILA